MNVKLHAKIQCNSTRLSTIISGDVSCSLFLKALGMSEHPQPHPMLILEIFSRDISNSLFQCTLGMPRHIWPHHQKITWSNCNLYSWLLQNHKGNYGASFKFKNVHIDGPNLIMPEHAWPHPIKITWSN